MQKEELAQYLKKVLEDAGAKVELTKVDYETYLNKVQSGDYSMYIGEVDIKRDCDLGFMFPKAKGLTENAEDISIVNPDESDNKDSADVLPTYTAESGYNKISNYSNATLDDIINNINSSKNEEVLKVNYNNLCTIYKEHAFQIPMYHVNDALLVSTRIKGKVVPNLTNFYADIGDIYIN